MSAQQTSSDFEVQHDYTRKGPSFSFLSRFDGCHFAMILALENTSNIKSYHSIVSNLHRCGLPQYPFIRVSSGNLAILCIHSI